MTPEERKAAKAAKQKRWKMKAKMKAQKAVKKAPKLI